MQVPAIFPTRFPAALVELSQFGCALADVGATLSGRVIKNDEMEPTKARNNENTHEGNRKMGNDATTKKNTTGKTWRQPGRMVPGTGTMRGQRDHAGSASSCD